MFTDRDRQQPNFLYSVCALFGFFVSKLRGRLSSDWECSCCEPVCLCRCAGRLQCLELCSCESFVSSSWDSNWRRVDGGGPMSVSQCARRVTNVCGAPPVVHEDDLVDLAAVRPLANTSRRAGGEWKCEGRSHRGSGCLGHAARTITALQFGTAALLATNL